MGLFDLFKKKKREPESPQLTAETHVVPETQKQEPEAVPQTPVPEIVKNDDVIVTANTAITHYINKTKIHDDIKDLLWFGDGPYKNFSKDDDYEILKSFKIGTIGEMLYKIAFETDEPSLIYMDLPVNKPNDVSLIPRPPYFPKYYQLTPEQRWIYLSLLVNPYNTAIDIGYVFILYYGLERHLLKGNFEKAFYVILKLRDVHTNKSFQDYSAHALILTSMIHQKGECAFLFLKSLDKAHEFNFSPNLLLMLYVSFGVSLTAPEIMRMAKTFEFTNTNYIKKYPDIFLECLTGVITDKTGGDSIDLKKYFSNTKLAKIPVYDTMVFANSSIANASVPVPLLCQDFALKKDMFNLLDAAHEKVKARVAELRSNGVLLRTEKQVSKPQFAIEKKLLELPEFCTEIAPINNDESKSVLEKFDALGISIEEAYKKRDIDPKFIEQAIIHCKEQIALSSKMLAIFFKAKQDYAKEKASAGYTDDINEDVIIRELLDSTGGAAGLTADLIKKIESGEPIQTRYDAIEDQVNRLRRLRHLHYEAEGPIHYRHKGFTQLCILEEKAGNYKELLELATQAKKEGWYGDWDKRIEKAKKKLGEE
jgi:hypothetical protein